MTIAITVCLTDGALLIADGKRTKPFSTNEQVQDNVNKIHRIGQRIGVISFGIETVTETAIKIIRRNVVDSARSSPQDVVTEIERSVGKCWRSFLQTLSPDIERNHPSMRAGFLVGGIARNINFIGGVLFWPDGHKPPTIETEPSKYIVLGGEEQNSQRIFADYLKKLTENIRQEGANDKKIYELSSVCAGALTIREVEKTNPAVGGTIRYVTIRRDCLYCEGVA